MRTMPEYRGTQLSEKLTHMTGFEGPCRHCGDRGLVKMSRCPYTFRLEPGRCWCLLCGQKYFMSIPESELPQWEKRQRSEKDEA